MKDPKVGPAEGLKQNVYTNCLLQLDTHIAPINCLACDKRQTNSLL